MASCDVQTLLSSAACFDCLSPGLKESVKLQLLCEILTAGGGGGGGGSVTSVSVVTANGVSGSVANWTTTPAITLTLGDITPTRVNGNIITAGTGTLTLGAVTLNAGPGGTLGTAAFTAATAYQPIGANLTAISALTSAADKLPYFTGAGTADVTSFSAAARTVIDDATVAAMVDTLGGASSTGTGGLVRAGSPTITGTTGVGAANSSGFPLEVFKTSVGIVPATGLLINNTTAATAGNPQYSPSLTLRGNAWSTGVLASRSYDWHLVNVPADGGTITARLYFKSQRVGASVVDNAYIDSTGQTYLMNRTAIGPNVGGPQSDHMLDVYEINADTSGTKITTGSYMVTAPGSASTAIKYGLIGEVLASGSFDQSGTLAGAFVKAQYNGTAIASLLTGIRVETKNLSGAGTITDARGVDSHVYTTTAAVTNAYAFYARGPFVLGAGSMGTFYGLYIENPTAAGTNYSIYSAGGLNYLAGKLTLGNDLVLPKTITAAGTTGDRTIDKLSGSVNFAIGATSLVVTNSFVSTSSVIICTVAANDGTMKSVAVVAAAGSFTIYPNAAPAAETRVNFLVTN